MNRLTTLLGKVYVDMIGIKPNHNTEENAGKYCDVFSNNAFAHLIKKIDKEKEINAHDEEKLYNVIDDYFFRDKEININRANIVFRDLKNLEYISEKIYLTKYNIGVGKGIAHNTLKELLMDAIEDYNNQIKKDIDVNSVSNQVYYVEREELDKIDVEVRKKRIYEYKKHIEVNRELKDMYEYYRKKIDEIRNGSIEDNIQLADFLYDQLMHAVDEELNNTDDFIECIYWISDIFDRAKDHIKATNIEVKIINFLNKKYHDRLWNVPKESNDFRKLMGSIYGIYVASDADIPYNFVRTPNGFMRGVGKREKNEPLQIVKCCLETMKNIIKPCEVYIDDVNNSNSDFIEITDYDSKNNIIVIKVKDKYLDSVMQENIGRNDVEHRDYILLSNISLFCSDYAGAYIRLYDRVYPRDKKALSLARAYYEHARHIREYLLTHTSGEKREEMKNRVQTSISTIAGVDFREENYIETIRKRRQVRSFRIETGEVSKAKTESENIIGAYKKLKEKVYKTEQEKYFIENGKIIDEQNGIIEEYDYRELIEDCRKMLGDKV